MKIAFFMSTILEQGGGLEKYLIETASSLTEKYNKQVDIITLDEKFTIRINTILTFYYLSRISQKDVKRESTLDVKAKLGKAGYINAKSFKELSEMLKSYDLIYSKNELLEAFILKYLIGYKNLPPVIMGVHTPHHYPITKSIQSKLHNFLYDGPIYNHLCKDVSAFHVSNKVSLSLLSKQFPNKFVYLVHYPFDSEKFSSLSSVSNNPIKKQVDKDKLNVVWVARLTEQKGVDDLIKLISKINESEYSSKIVFHIAGSGKPEYEILLKELSNNNKNVKYYGHIPNNEIPKVLSQMDVLLSTSKWEVSPFNILEAQSMNLPVIAFDIAGPQDIIINGQTGVVCKTLEDIMQEILSLIDNRDKFDNDISKSVKDKFSPKIIYPLILERFSEVKNRATRNITYNQDDIKWYDDNYYNKTQHHIDPWYRQLFKIMNYKNDNKDKYILEVGCGAGFALNKLKEFGFSENKIYGIDQSYNAIRQAKINIPQGNFIQGDAYKLPYEDNKFDIVLLMEVIEHFDHPNNALKEIHRVLKPCGRVYLSFPNYFNFPWLLLRILSEKFNRPNWIILQPIDKIYTTLNVRKLCNDNGLKFEKMSGSVYFPPILYKYELEFITQLLNKLNLYNLSFHPILTFSKDTNDK